MSSDITSSSLRSARGWEKEDLSSLHLKFYRLSDWAVMSKKKGSSRKSK